MTKVNRQVSEEPELTEPAKNLKAEQTALGACLAATSAKAIPKVFAKLVIDDFYKKEHRTIFSAVQTLAADDKAVEVPSVAQHLESRGELDEVGGEHYLMHLEVSSISWQSVDQYCDLVKDASIKRRLRRICQEGEEATSNGAKEPGELLSGLLAQLDELQLESVRTPTIESIDLADWLEVPPDDPDQVLVDTIDLGDKAPIIGPSKTRKSFFLLQLLLCIATGKQFLYWRVARPRKVLLVQMEIKEAHFRRRVWRMAAALGIDAATLGDRFRVINGRGNKELWQGGTFNMPLVKNTAKAFGAEAIAFDPLYKMLMDDENSAAAVKPTLREFDHLAEELGTANLFIHHDAKGIPGLRSLRDRGAGSGILARDFDACLTLTPHANGEAIVVETLLRNYPPQQPRVIEWRHDAFHTSSLPPEVDLGKTSNAKSDLYDYIEPALDLLRGPTGTTAFKENIRGRLHLSERRTNDLFKLLLETGRLVQQKKSAERGGLKRVGTPEMMGAQNAEKVS